MAADNRNDDIFGQTKITKLLRDEGRCTDDVEGCDTEDASQTCVKTAEMKRRFLSELPFRVEDAVLLENFGNYGHGGVDGVGNNENEGLGSMGGNTGSKIANNASVNLVYRRQDVNSLIGN